jgi:hypothetical protein
MLVEMRRRRSATRATLWVSLWLTGCSFSDLDRVGRPCSLHNPCPAGFVCVPSLDRCARERPTDASPLDGPADLPPSETAPDLPPVDTVPPDFQPPDRALPDACQPRTCEALQIECGKTDDGCQGTLQCPACGDEQRCVKNKCEDLPVDCSGIANNASYELCDSGDDFCAGVYLNGVGCGTFCAAAGLVCRAHFGGGPNCIKEPDNPYPCAQDTGHDNDWCECERR